LRKGLACFGLLISVVWIFDEGLLFVLGSWLELFWSLRKNYYSCCVLIWKFLGLWGKVLLVWGSCLKCLGIWGRVVFGFVLMFGYV
jgi:hypothetical protein